MDEDPTWQCANCDTLVEKADTDRCPTCGHVFFYPVATTVVSSEGSGSVRVVDFDVDNILEGDGGGPDDETAIDETTHEE